MKKRVFRRWAGDPAALEALIVARLGLARAEARRLVERGSVYVGGERVTARGRNVDVAQQVTVHLGASAEAPPLVCVYRDEALAVVDKPVGLPSQPERSQEELSLTAMVASDLGPAARVMHRLDKEASGLVVVALRKAAYAPLQRAFSEHAAGRRYLAIVSDELVGDGVVRSRIGRHPRDVRLRAPFPADSATGEPACTRYRSLGHGTLDGAPVTAIELELETGRTHQIRVHMMSLGHPLVGDAAYGGAKFERLCLHAYAIELAHPTTGEPLRVSAHVPEAFTWLVPRLTSPFS